MTTFYYIGSLLTRASAGVGSHVVNRLSSVNDYIRAPVFALRIDVNAKISALTIAQDNKYTQLA